MSPATWVPDGTYGPCVRALVARRRQLEQRPAKGDTDDFQPAKSCASPGGGGGRIRPRRQLACRQKRRTKTKCPIR